MSAHSLTVVRVTPRAPALSPEDRRAALVEVTIPLLREHGAGADHPSGRRGGRHRRGHRVPCLRQQGRTRPGLCRSGVRHTPTWRELAASTRRSPSTSGSWPRVTIMQIHVERIIGVHRRRCTTTGAVPSATATPTSAVAARDPEVDAAFVDLIGDDAASLRLPGPGRRRRPVAASRSRASTRCFPGPSLTPAQIVSVVLDGTRRSPTDAVPTRPHVPDAVRRDAGGAPRPPARRHARLAVPAQPERPDHRRGGRRR